MCHSAAMPACAAARTRVRRAVAVGDGVVGEEPVAQHGEAVDVHPLVVGEALAHTQHGEEVPRHRPVQLRHHGRLTGEGWGGEEGG